MKPVADLVDDAADTAEKLKLGWVSKLLDGFCSLFSWSPVSPCDALDWVGELEDKLCEATLGAAGAGEICGGGINFNLLEGTALTSQLDGLNTDLSALKIALEVVKTGEKLNELKDKFKTNKKIKDVLDKRATVNAVRDGLKGGLSSAVMAELGCAGKTPHQCIIDKMKEQMEKECAGVD